jgi:hypothetical protein
MSMYDPLSHWLGVQHETRIPLTFNQIEAILGFELPKTSRKRSQWWENNPNHHAHARAWLDAGFHTEEVNLAGETVTFARFQTGRASS